MNHQINSYLAMLIVTLVGAGLSVVIMRVANNTTFHLLYSDSGYALPGTPVNNRRS